MLDCITKDINFRKLVHAAPNKDTTILCWFWSPKTVLNPPVNGKIQEVFKAFQCFWNTFQGKFNFQGLFKTVLYIQVLFKPVQTLDISGNLADNGSAIYYTLLSQMATQTATVQQHEDGSIMILVGITYTSKGQNYCRFVKSENFIFANSIKKHISDVKKSRLRQDLPVSVNDRVILPFQEGFIFTKLRTYEVSWK